MPARPLPAPPVGCLAAAGCGGGAAAGTAAGRSSPARAVSTPICPRGPPPPCAPWPGRARCRWRPWWCRRARRRAGARPRSCPSLCRPRPARPSRRLGAPGGAPGGSPRGVAPTETAPPEGRASKALNRRLTSTSRSATGSPSASGPGPAPPPPSMRTAMVRPVRWASSCHRGGSAPPPPAPAPRSTGRNALASTGRPYSRIRATRSPRPGRPAGWRPGLLLLGVAHLPQQHFGAPQDGGQQVVEAVGHAHRQLAGGPQAFGAHELRRLAGALDGHVAANPRASSSSSVNGAPAGAPAGTPSGPPRRSVAYSRPRTCPPTTRGTPRKVRIGGWPGGKPTLRGSRVRSSRRRGWPSRRRAPRMPRPCGGCGRRSASSSGVSPVVSNATRWPSSPRSPTARNGVQERRQLRAMRPHQLRLVLQRLAERRGGRVERPGGCAPAGPAGRRRGDRPSSPPSVPLPSWPSNSACVAEAGRPPAQGRGAGPAAPAGYLAPRQRDAGTHGRSLARGRFDDEPTAHQADPLLGGEEAEPGARLAPGARPPPARRRRPRRRPAPRPPAPRPRPPG